MIHSVWQSKAISLCDTFLRAKKALKFIMETTQDTQNTQGKSGPLPQARPQHGRINTPEEILIGGLSAVTASVLTNPLDCIKMRMQLISIMQTKGKYSDYYRYYAKRAFVNAFNNRSISSLQAGLVPTACFQFIKNGLRLGFFAKLEDQQIFSDENGFLKPHYNVMFNGLTTAVGTALATPFWMAKLKLQKQEAAKVLVDRPPRYSGMLSVFWAIFRKTGLRGLYKGGYSWVPIATAESAIQLLTFNVTKRKLDEFAWIRTNGTFMAFMAALAAGCVTTLFATPLDVIQSRFVIQPHSVEGDPLVFRNYREVLSKVLKREGLSGFFRGIGLSYLKIGPHTFLTLFLWDVVRFSGYCDECR